MKSAYITSICLLLALTSCLKEELAFDVIESPVKASFELMSEVTEGMVVVQGQFMELDKSGILDHTIGIVETPVASMPITVYVFGDKEIAKAMTDTDGKVTIEFPQAELEGSRRLEWTGEHKGTPFRIYFKF